MTTIVEMLNRVKSINLREQVPVIIEDTKQTIIELNQRQLYNDSEDKNTDPLKLYGSLGYALEKNKKNPMPGFGRPDLYLTGAFFRGFNVKVTNTTFTISSFDSKTPDLKKQYGETIFGLTNKSKEEYANGVVYQGIQKYITNKTGLKFE